MKIKDARKAIERRVEYRPPGGPAEYGRITKVRGGYVVVRYDGSHWPMATPPELLEFVHSSPG